MSRRLGPQRANSAASARSRLLAPALVALLGGCADAAVDEGGADAGAGEPVGGKWDGVSDSSCPSCVTEQIEWSGRVWNVRRGFGGPGPNRWDTRNVFVDDSGRLHLRIAVREGEWTNAEIATTERLPFGRFQWFVESPQEGLDPNVTLGLFTYPTRDVGPDGTNEIDVELARWGDPANQPLNYNVWPATPGLAPSGVSTAMPLFGTHTTHRFDWRPNQVEFGSHHGFRDDDEHPIATWSFAPADPWARVPQEPAVVHMNLWLFRGQAPSDGAEVEVVIHRFEHTPL